MTDAIETAFEALHAIVQRVTQYHTNADQDAPAKQTGIELVQDAERELILTKKLLRKIQAGKTEYGSAARHLLLSARSRATIAAQWVVDQSIRQKFVNAVSVCISEMEKVLNDLTPDAEKAPVQDVIEFDHDRAFLLCAACSRVAASVHGRTYALAKEGKFKDIAKEHASSPTTPAICPTCNKAYCKNHLKQEVDKNSKIPHIIINCTCPKGHRFEKTLFMPV